MDAVQFGRWLAERRHLRGWPSQRALVDAAHAHPAVAGADISEAFLARLEAGHLARPFRGAVRQRVLMLAWLLCRTTRDVRVYLQVAGLSDLGKQEEELIERLQQRLGGPRVPVPRVLPARPARFVGRDAELDEILGILCGPMGGVVVLTGMPGVGKSTLAREVAHRCASESEGSGPAERDVTRGAGGAFGDGIVYQSVADATGTGGLVTLLERIADLFAAPSVGNGASGPGSGGEQVAPFARVELEPAIARARRALDGRSVLLILDGAGPGFPLREIVDALMPRTGGDRLTSADREHAAPRRGVLVTSRFLPPPSLAGHHRHLAPLAPEDALTLFNALVRHSLTDAEREHITLICAALGHVPLAIEAAATAVVSRGIPLDLLAAHVSEQALDTVLDGDGEVHAALAGALEPLSGAAVERFAALGALGAPAFGIEWVAALHPQPGAAVALLAGPGPAAAEPERASDAQGSPVGAARSPLEISRAAIATTAVELGELVRHSLLDVTPGSALVTTRVGEPGGDGVSVQVTRYRLHPLLAAFARDLLARRPSEVAEGTWRSAREYAVAFVERYQADVRVLEREREMLLATLTRAWQRHEYDVAVRLVSGLWGLIGRLNNYALSARILYWGISASERIEDKYHQARFLNRLGALYHYHGEVSGARQAWEASLRLAEALRRPAEVWHPLANLAMLACEAGDMERARRYADTYLRRGQGDGPLSSVAHALFNRGLCAHLQGDSDQAYADLTACTRLLAMCSVGDRPAHDGVVQLAAQAELARVQGDVARARHHTEMAVALAAEVSDHYTVADLLLDQARFACAQRQSEEARTLASRVVEVATRIEAHQLRQAGLDVLRRLPAGEEIAL